MVDELTNESYKLGKAVVSISVDILKSIAEACRIAQNNKQLSGEQQKNLVSKVVEKVVENYKETHGSLKAFNKASKDVTHIDVTDDEIAQILKKTCKKAHLPVDLKPTTRADGTVTYTAFCEVKNIDQVAGLLKDASLNVMERQKEITNDFYYHQTFLSLLWVLPLILISLCGCYFAFEKIEENKIGKYIAFSSINLNIIYIFQWMIIAYVKAITIMIGKELNLSAYVILILGSFIMIMSFCTVCFKYGRDI